MAHAHTRVRHACGGRCDWRGTALHTRAHAASHCGREEEKETRGKRERKQRKQGERETERSGQRQRDREERETERQRGRYQETYRERHAQTDTDTRRAREREGHTHTHTHTAPGKRNLVALEGFVGGFGRVGVGEVRPGHWLHLRHQLQGHAVRARAPDVGHRGGQAEEGGAERERGRVGGGR
eukprot:878838-Rhodomonas_salina.1